MSLSDIVSVSITAETTSVSREGFGTPLLAAYHTLWAERVREYSSLSEMVDDGFSALGPIYRGAAKIFGQNPRPQTLKIGRKALPTTQVVHVIPFNTTAGAVNSFTVVHPDGTETAVSYTNGGAETVATIVTALTALLAAIPDHVAVDSTTHVTCTGTAGFLFDYKSVNIKTIKLFDASANPGVATDLAAIRAEDSDWYGLALDSNSEAEVLAAAAWAEAEKIIFGANTADHGAKDAVITTDVMSDLETAAYARTFCMWSGSILSYAGAAWLGKCLPFDPGSETWAFKTLAGVAVDNLTTAEQTAIRNKTGNYYTEVAGVNITRPGWTAAGEFIDITRYVDFLGARLQENCFSLFVNNVKLPYTDASVDLVRAEILAQLRRGIAAGAIAADPEPTVTAPKVADIAAADRAARHLPDVTFTAQLAGAIHSLTITGTLSI